MALSARIQRRSHRVFVVMSDGECNEGIRLGSRHVRPAQQVDRLAVVIDYNKWQATGRSNEVMALEPLAKKWESFGWDALEVDGHDIEALVDALRTVPRSNGRPLAIVAHTVKGKGVSFMEDDNNWHYRVPNGDEVRKARVEPGWHEK